MKAKEIRDLAPDEIRQKAAEMEKEHFELRRTKATGKLENPLQMRLARRDYARVKTVLRELESK